ncbi:Patatin-like phospholipase domain-containing protein CIMG_04897 [Durusdinium trenchii]|uniref:Patatin-like phospholipase domain-containing protein CIMG_04897 n=1 Tax=Durusdinium trenchii TaxID=1381693 RepID=A0ABP0L803_9DINO
MFSSSVLGLARFARFQYQLFRISIDTLLLMVLSILTQVEDWFTLCTQCLHSGLSRSVRKYFRLERDLKRATSFAEYRRAEEAFRKMHSICRPICRRPSGARLACSCEEHLQVLHMELEKSLEAKGTEDLAKLEPLLVDQAGGVEWSRVPNAEQQRDMLKDPDWLVDRRKAIGRTALCLSGGGSLAMHHMGVCRFLLEASTSMRKGQQNRSSLQWMGNLDLSCWGVQKLSAFRCHQHTVIAFESWQEGLMPKIVSGVSGGSIVAGFLAIHTDEEKLGYAYSHELFNFLQLGVLVPTEDFEGTCQAYFGTWTFEEAYRRTGRPVTIVISSNFSRKLPACVMLNHMTVPRVTVASAVAASCAAIGVMRPRGLVVKDPLTGTLAPFNVLGESFADGSFTAEVPKDYLRSCFGATRFLVSQVNPHVSSFMDAKGGVLHSLRGHFGFDLQQRARMLSEYNLLPSFFGRAMCQATKHLSQDFQENKSGLTVHPPHVGLASVKAAISNPSLRDMERYILQGQRMAWEKAHEIRIMMLLEARAVHNRI